MKLGTAIQAYRPGDRPHAVVAQLSAAASTDPHRAALEIDRLSRTFDPDAAADVLTDAIAGIGDVRDAVAALGNSHFAVATDAGLANSALSIATAFAAGDRIAMQVGAVQFGLDVVGHVAHTTPFGAQADVVVTILKLATVAARARALLGDVAVHPPRTLEEGIMRSFMERINSTQPLAPHVEYRAITLGPAPLTATGFDWSGPGRERLAASLSLLQARPS